MGNYLVTGACGGMGKAVCALLTEQGHAVFGIDLAAGECSHEVAGNSFPLLFRADVTDTESLSSAAAEIRCFTDSLDGIVHTAGIYDLNSLLEIPEEDILRDFGVNLFGAYRVNKAFAPFMGKGGRVVIISSELAPLVPLPFTGIYAVTKSAVDKYAQALRMEAQLLGWKVSVVRPGAVRTGMLPESEGKLDSFVSGTKLYPVNAGRFRRIVGKVEARNVAPEKVARVIAGALSARRPKLTYSVNRNPLLIVLNALPERLQLFIIRKILE